MQDSIAYKLKRQFSITNEGYIALTRGMVESAAGADFELILHMLGKFCSVDLSFISDFNTKLWTLMSEIATPNDLGLYMPDIWPVLVFPSGMSYISEIRNAITKYGAKISEQIPILLNEDIHAQLYAGQQWYPALRSAFQKSITEFSAAGLLIWMSAADDHTTTLAAVARRLQLQLRPGLPEVRIKYPSSFYPGIQRAFHTPRLDNVAIQSLILRNTAKHELS